MSADNRGVIVIIKFGDQTIQTVEDRKYRFVCKEIEIFEDHSCKYTHVYPDHVSTKYYRYHNKWLNYRSMFSA